MDNTKEAARKFIEEGGKCIYRYGWAYRGAGARELTKDKALELLPTFSFGMGFYELSWRTLDGNTVLEFNELSENDMW